MAKKAVKKIAKKKVASRKVTKKVAGSQTKKKKIAKKKVASRKVTKKVAGSQTKKKKIAKKRVPKKNGRPPIEIPPKITKKTTSLNTPKKLRDYVAISNKYIDDVLSGKIVACKLVKLSCKRQLKDLSRSKKDKEWPYVFNEEKASRICEFFEEEIYHVKGEWAKKNERIVLEGWQCFMLTTVFGWVHRDTGLRRFTRVYDEEARKNSKSTKAAGIALYMTGADGEEGAETYALAKSKEQAGIVWKYAQAILRKNPSLRKGLGFSVGEAAITVPKKNAIFKSKPGKPGDGDNPHCVIVDEFHEHRTAEGYDAMYNGMGARSQPLIVTITTAGYNRGGPCFQQRAYAKKVLEGRIEDDSFFVIIYTLDDEDIEGDGWTKEENWIKANPNLGVSVSIASLREGLREAISNPSKQTTFKTKKLNIWVGAGSAWADMAAWDRNARPDEGIELFFGKKGWAAVDLASRIDVAALIFLIQDGANKRLFEKFYAPEEVVLENAESTMASYAGWASDGWLTLTPGNVIDYAYIKKDLLYFTSKFQIESVGYDPFQATQFSTECFAEGVPMVEVKATVGNFSSPMKEVEGWMKSSTLLHDGNPMMGWMMSNVVGHYDEKENIYPRKESRDSKIDGPVALIMAANRSLAIDGEKEEENPYEERGIRTVELSGKSSREHRRESWLND